MKKLVGIALIVAVALTLCLGTVAMAADPVDVNMNWSGSGSVGTTVTAGNDGVIQFATGGTGISGTFTARDWNDNPYAYNVDTIQSYLDANVTEGSIWYQAGRTDSYAPMYGPAGQQSGAFVGTSDGSAAMAVRTTTNYAKLIDPTYKYQLPGGHNITVDGSLYAIERWVSDSQGNYGSIFANGSGSAVLDCMVSEAFGTGIRFGWGGGCYTDASYNATGSGYFNVTGVGNSSVVYEGLGISSGGGSLSIIADFVNGFSIGDYSLTAK